METPSQIIIDTSVFRAAGFNYGSLRFAALNEILQFQKIELVLPDPIVRELAIHFDKGIDDAWNAIAKVRKTQPLTKNIYSSSYRSPPTKIDKQKVYKSVWEDFGEFVGKFDVVHHLGYEYSNMVDIMDWKDLRAPPFSEKKPKEYSDALIISIAIGFSRASKKTIAIISEDDDIRAACDVHAELVHYKNPFMYAEARHPDVQNLVKMKSFLLNDTSFRKMLANCIENSEVLVRTGWDVLVHGVEVSEVYDIEFAAILEEEKNLTIVLKAQISSEALLEHMTIDGHSEYPWKEKMRYHAILPISGVLTAVTAEEGSLDILSFESEETEFEFG